MRKLTFIISSLSSGGAEKVISEIVNYSAKDFEVNLIVLTKQERFFSIDDSVNIYEPSFVIDDSNRIIFKIKNFLWLRKTIKNLSSNNMLSFGGKYNSFVLLASLGLGKNVFVSDRSRPGISYGKFLNIINPITYKFSKGIVAQTETAKQFLYQKSKHKNIEVIPNPITLPDHVNSANANGRENIILNVGRFIKSKHQDWLVNYFSELNIINWELVFLGDGNHFEDVRLQLQNLRLNENISLKGNVGNVSKWYSRASIFAFTSTSEGFPNALAEAMSHGCACISFDCVAGPSDIIDDGINGFLIPEGNHKLYMQRLRELVEDENLRKKFSIAATRKMQQFDKNIVIEKYINFINK